MQGTQEKSQGSQRSPSKRASKTLRVTRHNELLKYKAKHGDCNVPVSRGCLESG